MVTLKIPAGRRARDAAEPDEEENGHLDEQNYIQALGTDNIEGRLQSDLQIDCRHPARVMVLSLIIYIEIKVRSMCFTRMFFSLYDKMMRMELPEWLEPQYSPSTRSNGVTAWLRQVRAFVFHTLQTNTLELH